MTERTRPETPSGRPLGDTGDGHTGVPDDEQGISNRPGDRRQDAGAREGGNGDVDLEAVDTEAADDAE